jgi:hypothetical protein
MSVVDEGESGESGEIVEGGEIGMCGEGGLGVEQGVTKRCRLSWQTNSFLEYEPEFGEGGVPGSQPMYTAVHRSPSKLRIYNSI